MSDNGVRRAAVVGRPIAHSRSPQLHLAAYRALRERGPVVVAGVHLRHQLGADETRSPASLPARPVTQRYSALPPDA